MACRRFSLSRRARRARGDTLRRRLQVVVQWRPRRLCNRRQRGPPRAELPSALGRLFWAQFVCFRAGGGGGSLDVQPQVGSCN